MDIYQLVPWAQLAPFYNDTTGKRAPFGWAVAHAAHVCRAAVFLFLRCMSAEPGLGYTAFSSRSKYLIVYKPTAIEQHESIPLMKTIDDSNRKIFRAALVADELGITAKAFVSLALKLNLTLLVEVPDNTEIYLKGITLSSPPHTFLDALEFSPTDPDAPVKVSSEIKYLCLKASDCELALEMGNLKKNEFQAVSLFEKGVGPVYLNPDDYTVRFLARTYKIVYIKGAFFTFQKTAPSLEKSITIIFDEILISVKHLQAIKQGLESNRPNYGKLTKEEWTSTTLARLNEASTFFFSGEFPSITSQQKPDTEIRNWLLQNWNPRPGNDLLMQAINAILPDKLYLNSPPKEKVSDALRSEYNTYTSTSLIILNEAAKMYWNIGQANKTKNFPKRETIKAELQAEWGITVKLAAAAATIIRPDPS